MIAKSDYAQVIGVLKYVPLKYAKLIPNNILEEIVKRSDNDYSFNYNPNITFEEQGITDNAREILSKLYTTYIKDEYLKNQRKNNTTTSNYNNEIFENEISKIDNTSKNNKTYNLEKTNIDTQLASTQKESFIKRLIKRLFHIN